MDPASKKKKVNKPGGCRPFLDIFLVLLIILMLQVWRESPKYMSASSKSTSADSKERGLTGNKTDDNGDVAVDFWWMTALKGASVQLDKTSRKFNFPSSTKRIWIDVGVHAKSDFIVNLDSNPDLFVLGLEPSTKWKPCPHQRCVVFWAAGTPTWQIVELNVQGGDDLCNSLLAPHTATTSKIWKGCVTQLTDKTVKEGEAAQPLKLQVPGMPLYALVEKVPDNVVVEYIKIDAQGFDLEVMKGVLRPTETAATQQHKIHVVSLEAMDVDDKEKLIYVGQPMLSEIQEFLKPLGWHYISSINNKGVANEVNAFFVSDMKYQEKVPQFQDLLMSNKEGKGKRR